MALSQAHCKSFTFSQICCEAPLPNNFSQLPRGWSWCGHLSIFGMAWNQQAGRHPIPPSPPPLLPAGVEASSHPLQLVGEMEVGATATTTYYGVTQQLLEQEALPLLSFLTTQLSHALFVAMYKLYKLHKLYKLYKLQCTSPKLLVTHLSPYGWLA